jgi:PleD family two-component response regulator
MDSIIDVSLLMENDPELSNEAFRSKHSIFSKLASEESIEATRAALEMKQHEVSVVVSGAEALDQIKAIIPNGAEVYHTGSVTLVR